MHACGYTCVVHAHDYTCVVHACGYMCYVFAEIIISFLSPVLRESLANCLLELNLDSFNAQLTAEAPELTAELEDSNNSYIILALANASLEGMEPPASLLGHVVNVTFEGKYFVRVLPTLAEDVYLHIERVYIDSDKVSKNGMYLLSRISILTESCLFCEWSGSYCTQCLSGQKWHRPYREFYHPTVKHDHCRAAQGRLTFQHFPSAS